MHRCTCLKSFLKLFSWVLALAWILEGDLKAAYFWCFLECFQRLPGCAVCRSGSVPSFNACSIHCAGRAKKLRRSCKLSLACKPLPVFFHSPVQACSYEIRLCDLINLSKNVRHFPSFNQKGLTVQDLMTLPYSRNQCKMFLFHFWYSVHCNFRTQWAICENLNAFTSGNICDDLIYFI